MQLPGDLSNQKDPNESNLNCSMRSYATINDNMLHFSQKYIAKVAPGNRMEGLPKLKILTFIGVARSKSGVFVDWVVVFMLLVVSYSSSTLGDFYCPVSSGLMLGNFGWALPVCLVSR